MKRFAPRLVLLLALAALAGPSVAAAQAASEGLLLEVLTATASRQRTQQDPSRRPLEDRALVLANLAGRMPATVTHCGLTAASQRPEAFDPPKLEDPSKRVPFERDLFDRSTGSDSQDTFLPSVRDYGFALRRFTVPRGSNPQHTATPARTAFCGSPRAPPTAFDRR